MIDSSKIGKFIFENRKNKNLTQKQLAEKLNITDKAISKWETGRGIPDIELLEELSVVLDITILELLKGEKIENIDMENDNIIQASLGYSKSIILYKEKKMKKKNIINIVIALIIMIATIVLITYPKYNKEKEYINNFDLAHISEELYYAERTQDINDLGVNQYGEIVFKEPQKMYNEFLIEYKEEIEEIKKQHKLLPINRFNMEKYKTYGWQTFSSNQDFQKRIIEVTQFLDTYMNSF